MNAKRVLQTVVIPALFVILLFGGIAAAGWGAVLWGQARQLERTPAVPTPAPATMPPAGVMQLTILASGSGVTILEYQGTGVRCIIASGASVDMVCQNSETVPVQPTPDGPDKHQTQPQGLEANAVEFPRAGDGTPVLTG